MIPARFAPILFAFLLSGVMSALVSFVVTLRAVGWMPALPGIWAPGWLLAWGVAFPTALVFGPLTRRIVAALVRTG